jgi:hypothetical protein
VIFAEPVFGSSCWGWLIFTPGVLSLYPFAILLNIDENIFLSWTFFWILWASPGLDIWICNSLLISTIIKRLLSIWLCAENGLTAWCAASSSIVESNMQLLMEQEELQARLEEDLKE